MMEGMSGGMIAGMVLFWGLVLALLVLSAAALIKYLRSRK